MKNIPNHCNQDLFCEGKPADVQEFMDLAKTQKDKIYVYGTQDNKKNPLNFENFIPYPDELYEDAKINQEIAQAEKQGNTTKLNELKSLQVLQGVKGFNFYDYNIEHLGTKWGNYETTIVLDETKKGKRKVLYNFNSAWSPFVALVNEIGQKFPKLKFTLKYYEQGVGYSGKSLKHSKSKKYFNFYFFVL